jgi:hypothetical protein
MFPGSKEIQIAEMRRQEMLLEAERLRLARQAARGAGTAGAPLPALTATLCYARYLLTSLAAVASGIMVN